MFGVVLMGMETLGGAQALFAWHEVKPERLSAKNAAQLGRSSRRGGELR
jgi:hypothetical protein